MSVDLNRGYYGHSHSLSCPLSLFARPLTRSFFLSACCYFYTRRDLRRHDVTRSLHELNLFRYVPTTCDCASDCDGVCVCQCDWGAAASASAAAFVKFPFNYQQIVGVGVNVDVGVRWCCAGVLQLRLVLLLLLTLCKKQLLLLLLLVVLLLLWKSNVGCCCCCSRFRSVSLIPTHIHSHSLAHTQLLLRVLLLLLRCCCAATAAADLINSECQQLQQIDLNRTKNQIKSNEMKSKRISICIYVVYMYMAYI